MRGGVEGFWLAWEIARVAGRVVLVCCRGLAVGWFLAWFSSSGRWMGLAGMFLPSSGLSGYWAWVLALGSIAGLVVCCLFLVSGCSCLVSVVIVVSGSAYRISSKSLIFRVKALVGVFNRRSGLSGWCIAIGTQYCAGSLPCDLLASAEVSGRCWDSPPNSSLLWLAPIPVTAIYVAHFSDTIHLIRSL